VKGNKMGMYKRCVIGRDLKEIFKSPLACVTLLPFREMPKENHKNIIICDEGKDINNPLEHDFLRYIRHDDLDLLKKEELKNILMIVFINEAYYQKYSFEKIILRDNLIKVLIWERQKDQQLTLVENLKPRKFSSKR